MIRVLLVDDQPTVLQGLRMRLALEPDLKIVGEARNGAEALAMAPLLRPDVVLMDVEMPGIDGIEATEALRRTPTQMAVVLLTIHDDAATRARARQAGVTGFVSKHDSSDAVVAAIRRGAADPATRLPSAL